MPANSLDQVVSLCKRRGFIFPGSEIYGGLANTWDYGPLGIELKNRIRDNWWSTFVHKRDDMVGLDSGILLHPKTWEASGHIGSFSDPLVDCKECKERFRGDHLLEEKIGVEATAVLDLDQIQPMLAAESINCPKCGKNNWTEARQFNLMFETQQGVVKSDKDAIYLRPETAQGIFLNFKNIAQTQRLRLPFGVAQIGKSFRNEITPGNFTYRTREFEQMEIEYFVEPGTEDEHYQKWKELLWNWYKDLGINEERMRYREHESEELSHYSSMTYDVEYLFPWGWGELVGLANRGDYDLTQHEKFSGQDLKYTDPDDAQKKFLPYVVEPAFGLSRSVLIFLIEAYTEEELPNGDTRTVMKFDKRIAPVSIAILPLSKKEHLVAKAKEVHELILNETNLVTDFDVTGSIGKRYRRQDEIGTPLCITVDFGTLGEEDDQGPKDTVTIRDRDTLEQKRVKVSDLAQEIALYWKS